jgi:anaphase-promoting complex subunit 10
MELSMPKGWIDVPIEGAGGGADGNSLSCWFVRVIVLENHQNGKDTHVRGVKVYALDEGADTADNNPLEDMAEAIDEQRMGRLDIQDPEHDDMLASRKNKGGLAGRKYTPGDGGLSIPDFMRDPEIR